VQTNWNTDCTDDADTRRSNYPFYKVYNVLGYGFLENVYENAPVIELKSAGFKVLQQQNIKV